MAIASANAIPKSIAGKILPEASGFLPSASIAFAPIKPTANAGPKPPMAIIRPPEILKFIYKFSPPLNLANLFYIKDIGRAIPFSMRLPMGCC